MKTYIKYNGGGFIEKTDRRPGGSKLVYDRKTKAIRKVTINRFERLLWWATHYKRVILHLRKGG